MPRKKKVDLTEAFELARQPKRRAAKRPAPAPVLVEPKLGELEVGLDQSELELQGLLDDPKLGMAYQRDLAVAEHRCWRYRARILFIDGKHSEAYQASKTAEGLASQAAKLEQASLGDRVLELERRIAATRHAGNLLEELD